MSAQDSNIPAETDTTENPWDVPDWEFPWSGNESDKLRFLLRYAVLAPSGHNTQPWLFAVEKASIALYADRTRALSVVDPGDRELIMSCGAALFHLRVAIRHFGYEPVVHTFPDAEDQDCLAVVRLGTELDRREAPTPEDHRLFKAIKRRHTNRLPFDKRAIPERELMLLKEAARLEAARLHLFTEPAAKQALADLIAEADRIQGADPLFRRELAAWVHPNRSRTHDGIPGYAQGVGDLLSYLGPFVVRTFDRGTGQAARDRDLAEGSPALGVLATDADDAPAHLAAGQALDRVLLTACAYDLDASFLNQPLEVAALRPSVAEIIGGGHPQIILRMGYGPDARATPRRPVSEVVSHPGPHKSGAEPC